MVQRDLPWPNLWPREEGHPLVHPVIRNSCMRLVQKDPMEEGARDTQSSHPSPPPMRPEQPDMQN
jgi:hypothetical protein